MRPPLFSTAITQLLGIDHPILCGGLGPQVADARYVAAVGAAGGMGFIAAAGLSRDALVEQLRLCQELSAGRPFGVNCYISRRPGSVEALRELIPDFRTYGVTAVETAGANPEPLIGPLKDAGLKVLHKAPGVPYAQTSARLGVDAVIVVGYECGGHPGTRMIGTMVQAAHAPQVIDIPVIVAGGIGSGQQLAAVIAMGGAGVLLGTRMLVAEELWIHDNHKRRIIESDGTENIIIKSALRDNHRVFANDTTRDVLALESQGITDFEAYRDIVSGVVTRAGYESGAMERGTFDTGQSSIFATRIEPVETIFDTLIDEASAAANRLSGAKAK